MTLHSLGLVHNSNVSPWDGVKYVSSKERFLGIKTWDPQKLYAWWFIFDIYKQSNVIAKE